MQRLGSEHDLKEIALAKCERQALFSCLILQQLNSMGLAGFSNLKGAQHSREFLCPIAKPPHSLCAALVRPHQKSSSGLPSIKETCTYWRESNKGLPR